MEQDQYYVGVRNPVELRRTILEGSKEIIESLQRYENFKELRKQKDAEIAKLKSHVKDINKLIGKLKSALPKSKVKVTDIIKHDEEKTAPKKSSSKKKKTKKSSKKPEGAIQPKQLTEIEKLESELNDIESRLGGLG